MRQESKTLLFYLEALGEERVHVIRTASHAEGEGRRGEGEAEKWGLEVERSTEQERGGGGRGESLNHRDRELECGRGSVLNVCFSGE